MKALPPTDRRSWAFQAAIHGTDDKTYTNPLFNQCTHSDDHGNLYFFPWHRAYVYFFERILRWAANDPTLMLPFWDWTTYPVLPAAFRYPADESNPLYEAKRLKNDGSPLLSSTVVDDLEIALGRVSFSDTWRYGFSHQLEKSPHGNVHNEVGGLMGAVPTAARDPIFWLHHANIDRLWNVWLNQSVGRAALTDASYLDNPYTFADETGGTVTVRVRDIISSQALGYAYEGVPSPPAQFVAAEAKPVPPRVVASSAPEKPEAKLEKVEAKPLGFEEKRVKLHPLKETRRTLREALPGARPPGEAKSNILVTIEGISAEVAPGFVYRVYIYLPDGERSEDMLRQHYIGAISFFGKTRRERLAAPHQHGSDEFSDQFDATQALARLRAGGQQLDPDALTITILPAVTSRPGRSAEQVRTKAAAVAEEAKVSYKRISVRVIGGE
ncbi:MAG TPA: tyrosinase family protein [Gemmataceae bacterium]|nr:tyrosinase family protein [Gemmataceae bacterium]